MNDDCYSNCRAGLMCSDYVLTNWLYLFLNSSTGSNCGRAGQASNENVWAIGHRTDDWSAGRRGERKSETRQHRR